MTAIYLSIGSNIDRQIHVPQALQELQQLFRPITCSRVYESEAVGFSGDPFYNLAVGFESDWPLDQLLDALQQIESKHRRQRGAARFAPRTLDIDLLLFGDRCCDQPQLPRSEILTCAFVLRPLAEIAPDLCHPCDGRTYAELWEAFDDPEQRLWPVELPEACLTQDESAAEAG